MSRIEGARNESSFVQLEPLENPASLEVFFPEENLALVTDEDRLEIIRHSFAAFIATVERETILDALEGNPCFLEKAKVDDLKKRLGCSAEELMQKLLQFAKTRAIPHISNYFVGAVALGKSGNIYLGGNLEFSHLPLGQTVHAEQFVITHARQHEEKELVALAVTAAPCGHCRQFMNEIGYSVQEMKILLPATLDLRFSDLLPSPFGPKNLGLEGGMMAPSCTRFVEEASDPLTLAAIKAANNSYTPYTDSPSGVALYADGKIYTGSYLENVAYNPSLPPLQTALIALVADGKNYDQITEAVLVEKRNGMIGQKKVFQAFMRESLPDCLVHVELLQL